MGRRVTAGVELKDGVQAIVNEFCLSKAMPKKALVERILKWFAAQPPTVKSVVADLVDSDMREAYAAALESMARKVRELDESEPDDPSVSGGRQRRRAKRAGAEPEDNGESQPRG